MLPEPPASESDARSPQSGLPPDAPDIVEQDQPEEIDNVVPTHGYEMTPMVALGGSAGSVQPLTAFFHQMPPDSGMVFVVIQHLSPTHESSMHELLAHATKMPVTQAQDGEKVAVNRVYVIPPGKYLTVVNNHLRLRDLESERGRRVAIDLFFRSLADTHGPHAAAVVLSGADSDGALGIKRIKERGGLTISQDPQEAEYASMPQASINTGMIDWVLKIAQMPEHLLNYFSSERRLKLPPEDGPRTAPGTATWNQGDEGALRDVLTYLRTRTGRDFSYYKRATILRRVARRMQINGVDNLRTYSEFLRTHAGEAGALLQDLLISVTNFFRDRDAFAALEQYIPSLFTHKTHSDSVRVWIPACATGEEAYSIAMLLLEHARTLSSPPDLHVFACDLDEEAIKVARAGLYPDTISADVNEERLRSFFTRELGGYRVRREVREMVLFAEHDLLKDASFSRMDLVSCRNLLIYLNREAQQRVFNIFHFALKPGGKLFLGSSESIDDDSPLFGVLDKKHRIFVHQPVTRIGLPIPSGASALLRAIAAQEQLQSSPVVHNRSFVPGVTVPMQSRLSTSVDRASLAELHYRMVERLGPPSLIVDAEHEIVHLSQNAGQFLRLSGGEVSMNLLRVAPPSMRADLRAALSRAAETGTVVECFDVPVITEGATIQVNIRVNPIIDVAPGLLLVTFEESKAPPGAIAAPSDPATAAPEPAAQQLEREVGQVKRQLRDVVEQYEASTEELKASNEELQAMNEELRSATEELETSREELQSINEELTSVNQEMKSKMDELAHLNSDLQNLMASTSIATVFLDRQLAIMRFTPSATPIFHMIPGDVGRPLAHLKHTLDYPNLIEDAQNVLRTLVPFEREVRANGHWYLARIQPYRTLEDHIAGVVLTLVDVTERNVAIQALRLSEQRMRYLIESATDYAIFTTDRQRLIDSWNSGAKRLFDFDEIEIMGKSADTLFTADDLAKGEPEREPQLARAEGRAATERWHVRKNGSVFYGSGVLMPLRDQNQELRGYLTIVRDLTEKKRAEEAMKVHVDELTRFNAAVVGRELRMVELKNEINELCLRLKEQPRYKTEFAEVDGK